MKQPAEPILIHPHLGPLGWIRRVVTEVWFSWNRHRCTQLGAAIAFYGIFSLLPLLILMTSVFGFILASWGGAEGLKFTISHLIAEGVSPQVAKTAVDALTATESARGQLGIIGVLMILLAASGAFVQLETAAQIVWDVHLPGQKLPFRRHVLGFLRNRLVSFLLVGGAALLVFLSLVVDVMLNTVAKETLEDLGTRWRLLELTMGFFAAGGIVTILFRWLPARPVPWRAALVGGWLTAGLWEAAKQGLTEYLTRVDYARAYPCLLYTSP
ncbi:MAG: YihY/virulence factor BrkB family protein, partial [Candidatus Eisenbacteria bacterium]|nr:YihY/virulence factor BrkB family protein [Candidatus Eisenbacteria bacterium]